MGRGSRTEKQGRGGLWRELGGKSHRIWQLAAGRVERVEEGGGGWGRVGEGGEEQRVTQFSTRVTKNMGSPLTGASRGVYEGEIWRGRPEGQELRDS